ncbi:hypothetical protein GVAV_003518 [Gurleya vavrai]
MQIFILIAKLHLILCNEQKNKKTQLFNKKSLKDQFYEEISFNDTFNVFPSISDVKIKYDSGFSTYFPPCESFAKKTKSPIASVKIPSNKPVTNIIESGSTEIFYKTKLIFRNAIREISKRIEDDMKNFRPQVIEVIENGNDELKEAISQYLNDAFCEFAIILEKITKKENKEAEKNIKNSNIVTYCEIKNLLEKMQGKIAKVVGCGFDKNTESVLKALTEANSYVLKQIEDLLDDPKNKKPIFPQIIYADPIAISDLLLNTNNDIYNAILHLFVDTLHCIKKILDKNKKIAICHQTNTLDKANDSILKELQIQIDDAMNKIDRKIKIITKKETIKIKNILNTAPPELPRKIENIVSGIEKSMLDLFDSVTKNQVHDTKKIIKHNNSTILNSVASVLLNIQ